MKEKLNVLDTDDYWYTVDELAEELGLSVGTLRTQWSRTRKNLQKQGTRIHKWGRGDDCIYTIEEKNDQGYMTIDELADALGLSVSTLKYAFKRTQENYLKMGLYIKKEGTGENARYKLEFASPQE